MNAPLIIANVLTLLAFFVHAIQGDKELHSLQPTDPGNTGRLQERWTMARAGWHFVSFDLFWVTLGLTLINFTDLLPAKTTLLYVLAVYAAGTGIAWLLAVLISPRFPQNLLRLGQWMLLIGIGGLVLWGAYLG